MNDRLRETLKRALTMLRLSRPGKNPDGKPYYLPLEREIFVEEAETLLRGEVK